MKLMLDNHFDLEFNEWAMDEAEKRLDEVRMHHIERSDEVLRSMLALLLFGHIEASQPGTLERLSSSAQRIAKALKGPEPDDS
jgi:DNA-binding TFAR19-related protein (PDSD5 family)